jgi:hypothetical protein
MDFETHPRGTTAELKASRELAQEIKLTIEQYSPGIIPHNILQAYNRLYGQYIKQMQQEDMTHE